MEAPSGAISAREPPQNVKLIYIYRQISLKITLGMGIDVIRDARARLREDPSILLSNPPLALQDEASRCAEAMGLFASGPDHSVLVGGAVHTLAAVHQIRTAEDEPPSFAAPVHLRCRIWIVL